MEMELYQYNDLRVFHLRYQWCLKLQADACPNYYPGCHLVLLDILAQEEQKVMLNSKCQAENKAYKNDSKFVYVHEIKILQLEALYKYVLPPAHITLH
jgi:hypothetical protein